MSYEFGVRTFRSCDEHHIPDVLESIATDWVLPTEDGGWVVYMPYVTSEHGRAYYSRNGFVYDPEDVREELE